MTYSERKEYQNSTAQCGTLQYVVAHGRMRRNKESRAEQRVEEQQGVGESGKKREVSVVTQKWKYPVRTSEMSLSSNMLEMLVVQHSCDLNSMCCTERGEDERREKGAIVTTFQTIRIQRIVKKQRKCHHF
jgi:hypothetical protein